jgi:cysteine-rich repeat protein
LGGTGGDPATSSAGSGGETSSSSTGGAGGETSSSSTGGAGGETSSSSTGGAGGAMPMPCGDGAVGGGEQCDDGNATGGDGCSASCQIEPFFQCSLGAPSVCAGQEVLCGDGVDNDGDAFIDGLDTDCVLPAYAPAPPCPGLRIYRSINVPVVIPDGGEASSPIVVADTFQVEHTAVLLDIAHPYTGDLDVRLIPPFGSPRNLTTDNGGSGDDYSGTLLDSECAGSVISGSAPFSDCYKPESSLPGSAQEAHGTWTLSVGDDSAGQTGTLEGFTLILCGQ